MSRKYDRKQQIVSYTNDNVILSAVYVNRYLLGAINREARVSSRLSELASIFLSRPRDQRRLKKNETEKFAHLSSVPHPGRPGSQKKPAGNEPIPIPAPGPICDVIGRRASYSDQ